MKKTVFLLGVMAALVLNSCSKSEQDEPDVKKPSIEEVLRLDDILYVTGETIDVDAMTAQYQKIGYSEVADLRRMVGDKMVGLISYWNPEYSCRMGYNMDGSFCLAAGLESGLFTYNMKDEAIAYLNKRFGISLQKLDGEFAWKEFFRATDESVTFGVNDANCMVQTKRHP